MGNTAWYVMRNESFDSSDIEWTKMESTIKLLQLLLTLMSLAEVSFAQDNASALYTETTQLFDEALTTTYPNEENTTPVEEDQTTALVCYTGTTDFYDGVLRYNSTKLEACSNQTTACYQLKVVMESHATGVVIQYHRGCFKESLVASMLASKENLYAAYTRMGIDLTLAYDLGLCNSTYCSDYVAGNAAKKTCSGLRRYGNHHGHMKEEAIRVYKGCQIVNGNLELNYISSKKNLEDINDAIKDIEEVTGYVMIYMTECDDSTGRCQLSLPKLRIIRGIEKLMRRHNLYSLYVWGADIYRLSVPNLKEILHGNVYIKVNTICFMTKIRWSALQRSTMKDYLLLNNTTPVNP